MYGGENSGMPFGPDPVNNGTGTFGAENDYDQPAAIVSGGEDGGAVAFDSSKSDKSAKYFGHRSREKAAKQSAPQVDMNLVAASNIASNPNNPEFFRQAAIDNTTAQIQRQPRKINKKPIIVVCVLLLVIGAAALAVYFGLKTVPHYTAEQQYVNYIVNGDVNKNDNATSYASNNIFYFNEVFRNGSDDDFYDFYDKAKSLLEAIPTESVSEEYASLLKEQEAFLDLFKVYRELAEYDGERLGTIYVERGFSSTSEMINEKLNTLNVGAHDYISEYKDKMSTFVKSVSDVAGIYYEAGCKGDTVEELSNCTLPEKYMEKYNMMGMESVQLYEKKENVVSLSATRYIKQSFMVLDKGEHTEGEANE